MFHNATVVVYTKVQIKLNKEKNPSTETKKKIAYHDCKLKLTILCAHFSTTMMIKLWWFDSMVFQKHVVYQPKLNYFVQYL